VPVELRETGAVEPTTQKVIAANGTDIEIIGITKLIAKINGVPIEIVGYVTPNVDEVTIGIDMLRRWKCVWDFDASKIQLLGTLICLKARPKRNVCRRIVLANEVTIPPHSEVLAPGTIVFSDHIRMRTEETWVTECQQVKPGMYVASVVVPPRALNIPTRLANVTNGPIHLPARTTISSLMPVEVCEGATRHPLGVDNTDAVEARHRLAAPMVIDNLSASRHPLGVDNTDVVEARHRLAAPVAIDNQSASRRPLGVDNPGAAETRHRPAAPIVTDNMGATWHPVHDDGWYDSIEVKTVRSIEEHQQSAPATAPIQEGAIGQYRELTAAKTHVREVNMATNGIDVNEDAFMCQNIVVGNDSEIRDLQVADVDIGWIREAILSNAAKPVWAEISDKSAESKALSAQWDRLKVEGEILVRRYENTKYIYGKRSLPRRTAPYLSYCNRF
jgi:hypothetical protein